MSHKQPPDASDTLPFTVDDWLAAGLADILALHRDTPAYALSKPLFDAARSAEENGQARTAAALAFLGQVASMRLTPSNRSAPLSPVFVAANGDTSMRPDAIAPPQITALSQLVQHITHDAFRALVADLMVLRLRGDRRAFVTAAIEGYLAMPINSSDWPIEGSPRWHRALQLALQFAGAVGNRVEEIEQALLDAVRRARYAERAEALWYLRILEAERLLDHAADISAQLRDMADERHAAARYDDAETLYACAATWFGYAKDQANAAAMLVARARSLIHRADLVQSPMVQQGLYDDAVRHYRAVPSTWRNAHGVDQAIEDARRKLEAAGRRALGVFKSIKMPSVNVTDLVKLAREQVADLEPLPALIAFCSLDDIPRRADYVAQAERQLEGGIIGNLFGIEYLGEDGHVVATIPPLTGDPDKDAPAIEAKAWQQYVQHASLMGASAFNHALAQLQIDQTYSVADFQLIARDCPLVPIEHADDVGWALYAGYRRDLATALHILVPKFEHMVRIVLKDAGALTTIQNPDGTTMEVGLSNLVTKPEMVEEFGEDLTFAVRALMCEQVGPNFRNVIAHGLITHAQCHSAPGLYTWWLILRVITEQWYARGVGGDTPPDQAPTGDCD
jgi:hypothetical protein